MSSIYLLNKGVVREATSALDGVAAIANAKIRVLMHESTLLAVIALECKKPPLPPHKGGGVRGKTNIAYRRMNVIETAINRYKWLQKNKINSVKVRDVAKEIAMGSLSEVDVERCFHV